MNKFNIRKSIQNFFDTSYIEPYLYLESVNDIHQLIIDENYRNENRKIFRSSIFNNLIQLVSNMKNESIILLNKKQLNNEYKFKTYCKWIKPDKYLAIFKFNFSNINQLKNCFIKLIGNNQYIETLIKNIFPHLKTNKGLYYDFCNYCGILFFNNEINDFNVFKHEMIHFAQDVTGKIEIEIPEENGKFLPIEYLAQVKNLNVSELFDKNYEPKIINSKEIIPYINSICYSLEKLNLKEKPIYIFNRIKEFRKNLKNDDTLNKLIQYIDTTPFKNCPYTEKAFLIICLLYYQHINLFTKILSNYF